MNRQVITANIIARWLTFGRQTYAVFFTFAFPVILILVFGVIFSGPAQLPIELHVQDLDASSESRRFIERLEQTELANVHLVQSDADAGEVAFEQDFPYVIIIPRGFGSSEDRSISIAYGPSALSAPDRAEFLQATLVEVNQRLLNAMPFDSPAAQPPSAGRRRFLDFFVPGIIAMSVMTASLYGALHISAELRQKGILRKLAATPITRVDWLLSNILYQLILAIISTGVILIVSYAVFGVGLHLNFWLPIFLVLTVFTFVGLGLILAPFARDAEGASAAGNAVLFPMMFLSGTFFPIDLMPGVLQGVAYVLPLFYINEGLRASMVALDHAHSLMYAAITGAFALVVFIVGAMTATWDEGS